MKLDTLNRHTHSIQSLSLIEKLTQLSVASKHFLQNSFAHLHHRLMRDSNELRVWTVHHDGETLWNAFNPRTGRAIYHLSETEMRRWIEHAYNV